MAKVASRSWVEAAKAAPAQPGALPIHCHFVIPANRSRIEAVYGWPAAQQTIANMLLPKNLLRSGAYAWEQIESARNSRQKIRVVSGMRDPVARSISFIVFMADFYGHVSGPLKPRSVVAASDVVSLLQESWTAVLGHQEPTQTFEWLLWYFTGAFRTWFANELGAAFHVDVLTGSFNRDEAVQRVTTSQADIFLYRVEDMLPSAAGHRHLLAHANSFLRTSLGAFPSVNTSETRRSRQLSEDVRRRFWLPEEMLDEIFNEPVVKHFYDPDEIAAFRQRWNGKRLGTRR